MGYRKSHLVIHGRGVGLIRSPGTIQMSKPRATNNSGRYAVQHTTSGVDMPTLVRWVLFKLRHNLRSPAINHTKHSLILAKRRGVVNEKSKAAAVRIKSNQTPTPITKLISFSPRP